MMWRVFIADRETLMVKLKPLYWLLGSLVLLIVVVAMVFLLRYEIAEHDPCKQLSRVELAAIYPALDEMLRRQSEESSQLLAQQRTQDFMINLEMSSEQLNLEDALKSSTQQIEAVAALRQRHKQAFDALCQELVAK
jgi:hypothetical protein